MAEVVLENICKIFPGGIRAVDDVSVQIADREFIVLVGPSGCGKSTTLRMIAGLEDISGGTIRIGQRVVNGVAPKDRDIAMVFQNYALYPHMTAYRNMAFGLMLRRQHVGIRGLLNRRARREELAEIDRRVRTAARTLGIEDLLDRRPKALSGGQRQRVAVGRAIVRQPKAFLFDEPLSNLDAKLRIEMRAELKRLHREVQTTTVYVTHDQEEAMTLGDRVVVMKDGRVQQIASPFEIYERPVNSFVAGFVGTPPMNFLDGRISREADGLVFDDGEQRLPVAAAQQGKLAEWTGRPVRLGLRPESIHLDGAPDGAGLRLSISLVEPLGDRMDVHASTPRHPRIICRVDSRRAIQEGQTLIARIEMARAHFFEPDGAGRNLTS